MGSKTLALVLLFLIGVLFLSELQCARADDIDDDDAPIDDSADDIEITDDAGADDDDDDDEYEYTDSETEEYTGVLAPHPDVHTHFIFPDYAEKQFVVGKPVVTLISFANKGRRTFNITGVGAHLHSPFDFSYYIQNFTAREQDALVLPGAQVSVEYVFVPDPSLEPLEFWLSAWLQYNDTEGRTFRNTFTNGTIELIEKPSEFNAKSFFSYVVLVAVVAVGGFFFYNSQQPRSRKSVSSVERGTAASGGSDGGWGEAYVPKPHSGRVSRGKKDKVPAKQSS